MSMAVIPPGKGFREAVFTRCRSGVKDHLSSSVLRREKCLESLEITALSIT
jgi:hypothetical protein